MDRHGMTKTEAVHKGRNRAARKARAAEAAPWSFQRELGNTADMLICLATEMTKAGESDAAAKCRTAGYAILDARNVLYPPEGEDNDQSAPNASANLPGAPAGNGEPAGEGEGVCGGDER